jgi:hypothetical protein
MTTTATFGRGALLEASGGVFDYVSASRLNSWLACPLKFKLKYLDHVSTPSTPPLFVGKACHAGLELFYHHRMLSVTLKPTEVAGRLEASWNGMLADEDIAFESPEEEQATKRQTGNLIRAYLAYIPRDESRPLAVEAALESPLVDPTTGEDLGIPLVGIVDLILDAPTGPLIADFKTAARSSPPLEITHEVQLSERS